MFQLFNICHSLNNFNDGTLQEYIRKRREDTSAVLSQLNENSQGYKIKNIKYEN